MFFAHLPKRLRLTRSQTVRPTKPALCPSCGTPTFFGPLPRCLPCLTGWAWAADALDLRVAPPSQFSLLAFRRASPAVSTPHPVTTVLRSLETSIIKVCQYYQ